MQRIAILFRWGGDRDSRTGLYYSELVSKRETLAAMQLMHPRLGGGRIGLCGRPTVSLVQP